MSPCVSRRTRDRGEPRRAVVLIGGPTASGKSALALALAERLGGAVVNADSMQIYRDLPILSARPDAAAIERVPHRLYGVLGAEERCSAGRWRAMAVPEIEALRDGGLLPVVVGGTGLYLEALQHGLADIPPVPADIARATEALIDEIGPAALHARLAAVDAERAAALEPGDRQRIARAWGVFEATGRTLTEWRRRAAREDTGLRFLKLLVMAPREAVYAACDARFAAMLDAGALDEVARLAARGLDPSLPAMKALGVRPLLRLLAGEIDRAEALRLGQRDTRRYAKRQMTWFRHRYRADRVEYVKFSESPNEETFSFISSFLLTDGE